MIASHGDYWTAADVSTSCTGIVSNSYDCWNSSAVSSGPSSDTTSIAEVQSLDLGGSRNCQHLGVFPWSVLFKSVSCVRFTWLTLLSRMSLRHAACVCVLPGMHCRHNTDHFNGYRSPNPILLNNGQHTGINLICCCRHSSYPV